MQFIADNKRNVITYLFLLASLLIGSLPLATQAQEPARIKAVATFSILGDLVKNVVGNRADLTVLVGPGADSHAYSPSAADVRALKNADIIFENGLSFEGWMKRLVASSGGKAPVIVISRSVPALENHDEEKDHHDHSHAVDPHAWQDAANVKIYVVNIRDALIAVDPAGKAVYEENAKNYLARLDALDGKIRATIAAIPEARRKVVTSHDAFGYFAKAYGISFIGLQGLAPDSEPSAKDVAAIIRQIKTEKIPAVFIETISDPRLMERIASETGARIGDRVYSDSLSSSDGPAPTYIGMMEHNLKALSDALK